MLKYTCTKIANGCLHGYHACGHGTAPTHVHADGHGAPPHTHNLIDPPPTPKGGGPPKISKNSIRTNQDISILFEDLKSVETLQPMDAYMVWWMGGLIGGVISNH